MDTSKLFTLNWSDVLRGVIVAILAGVALPVLAAIQTPGFDIMTANWAGIWALALNGGLAAMAGYLTKNLFSTDGKFLGKVG